MLHQIQAFFSIRQRLQVIFVGLLLAIVLAVGLLATPVQAATRSSTPSRSIDPYVARYLKVTEQIALPLDGQGQTREFAPQELSQGKQLFEQNCKTCHVGGATLPNPLVSLSSQDLAGATPPRNHIQSLVTYFRQPLAYDSSEEAYLCRQIPESWMSQTEVENLAAFILRAADRAPGWGTNQF